MTALVTAAFRQPSATPSTPPPPAWVTRGVCLQTHDLRTKRPRWDEAQNWSLGVQGQARRDSVLVTSPRVACPQSRPEQEEGSSFLFL